ncbi:glycosyltransferase family 34 protein [Cercospora zeae-maydis SCOH1-5]|uniref:Glycosyltransferase family 34 protein n=1 Tax=Cercospora zeae-maydis SCOH1-5 TaxID=717836 RepID=A0A6A6EYM3_9PEZI|nr:glycosyltransferase family 34 protein [Cercospora zeae-maydis SCOH1-5]
MAQIDSGTYGRRSTYISRSRILLLAFLVQGYLAYNLGIRSVQNTKSPEYTYQPLDGAAPDLPMTCRSTAQQPSQNPKFVIGSMSDRETSYDWLVVSNKNRYAAKHGYDIIWDFEKNNNYFKDWDRLKAMEKVIRGKLEGENSYEWIWWTDYDSIITNSSIKLENLVDDALTGIEDPARRPEIDIIMTPDCWPMNSGSLLVRATKWSLEWIKEMWRQKEVEGTEGNMRSLQDCLRDMVLNNLHNIAQKGMFVKQYKMNAFPPEIHCVEDDRFWQPGDFMIHMAGAWAHVHEEDPTGLLLRKYAPLAV